MTRSENLLYPFREYHTSKDTAELMQPRQLDEMLSVLKQVVETVEANCRIHRRFDGLVCLSNPIYDLYQERRDPAVDKDLPEDAETWGRLLDSLLRYFDGSMTIWISRAGTIFRSRASGITSDVLKRKGWSILSSRRSGVFLPSGSTTGGDDLVHRYGYLQSRIADAGFRASGRCLKSS